MEKYCKRFFIGLSLVCVCILTIFRLDYSDCYLPLKMTASFSFVMTAVFAFLSNKEKSAKFRKMGIGFIVAAFISFVADFVIDVNFLYGMLLFFVSVLVYFFSCFTFGLPNKTFYIVTFGLYIPYIVIINLLPGFKFESFTIPVAVYSFTILIFTVKSFGVFRNKSVYAKMLSIGALLFILSDFDLLIKVFYQLSPNVKLFYEMTNPILYFPAQLLIANSLSKDFLKDNN